MRTDSWGLMLLPVDRYSSLFNRLHFLPFTHDHKHSLLAFRLWENICESQNILNQSLLASEKDLLISLLCLWFGDKAIRPPALSAQSSTRKRISQGRCEMWRDSLWMRLRALKVYFNIVYLCYTNCLSSIAKVLSRNLPSSLMYSNATIKKKHICGNSRVYLQNNQNEHRGDLFFS